MLTEKRKELCWIAKQLYDRNLVSGTDGNISMRIDGNSMLITPSGINKGMLMPSMLLLQNFDGTIIEGELRSTKEAGMHSVIYQTKSEINAVLHTHPAHATTFAACGIPIPQNILIEVPVLLGETIMVPYAKPGSEELVEGVRNCIRNSDILLLKNHGVLTCGKSLMDAFNKMDALENAAKTILLTKLIGEPAWIPESELCKLK